MGQFTRQMLADVGCCNLARGARTRLLGKDADRDEDSIAGVDPGILDKAGHNRADVGCKARANATGDDLHCVRRDLVLPYYNMHSHLLHTEQFFAGRSIGHRASGGTSVWGCWGQERFAPALDVITIEERSNLCYNRPISGDHVAMEGVVFTYSLPSKAGSSPRVTLWRRLRRLGAITPAGSIYVLPAREDCIEAFQWLAQEIRQARGDALVMHVGQFAGLPDPQVIALFQTARAEDYAALDTEAATLEQIAAAADDPEERSRIQEMLERLRRRHAEIVRVDYFDCPEGTRVAARLGRIQQALAPAAVEQVVPAAIAAYHAARWVTRPHPHVDRLACAWLIRRFVNPAAPIRYAAQPEPGEVAFDMVDAQFGHTGSLCTFETMLRWPDGNGRTLRTRSGNSGVWPCSRASTRPSPIPPGVTHGREHGSASRRWGRPDRNRNGRCGRTWITRQWVKDDHVPWPDLITLVVATWRHRGSVPARPGRAGSSRNCPPSVAAR